MKLVRTTHGVAILPQGDQPPIAVRHIIGIGRNYAEHAREQGAELPTRPMVFTKSPFCACLHEDAIVIPKVAQEPAQVDFEAELAVIIGTGPGGKLCRDVQEADALSYVMGYTCANDVSARWWQKDGSGGQFFRGKSFDTFCPMGPDVMPASAVKDPQHLKLICRVNGSVMQDGTTSDMIFGVANLVADLSRGATLHPGTVILTGTPSGVGFARKPPVYLKDGDVVEVEIPGIGTLRNSVRAE